MRNGTHGCERLGFSRWRLTAPACGDSVILKTSLSFGAKFVAKVCPIKVGKFEGFSWIRCEGKGSFLNSPAVKEFGESRVTRGEVCLVVDLEACTGMDSTFMGTLAGLATRISEKGGMLDVAGADTKSRDSLEDLGLDFFMEINPETAVWKDVADQARDMLKSKVAGMKAGTVLHTRHILEAHEVLSDTNEGNKKKFSGVVGMLGAELAEKTGNSR
jgi:anti-sigma B factor antagonist